MSPTLKRIGTDAAGYGLILLGIASGWLPGPGGIPLILGGLGLLSIHNEWARRLRDWLLAHGGKFIEKLFPKHPYVQAMYDLIALILFAIVAWLSWHHAAVWQISLAIALFCIAVVIAGMNRDRFTAAKRKFFRKTDRQP